MAQVHIDFLENTFANKKLVRDVTLKIFHGSDGIPRINGSGFLKEDLSEILVHATLSLRPSSGGVFKDVIRSNVDFCDFQKYMWAKMLYKVIEDTVRKYSNFKFECPYKKGFYYGVEYPILSKRDPSMFSMRKAMLGGVNSDFKVVLSVRAKAVNSKSLSKLLAFTSNGTVEV